METALSSTKQSADNEQTGEMSECTRQYTGDSWAARLFDELDANNDSELTREELMDGLRVNEMEEWQIDALRRAIDTDGDGLF